MAGTQCYDFDGAISREVLENYLERAVTAQGLVNSDTLADDIRMLARIGAKFIGRATNVWVPPDDDDAHFRKVAEMTAAIHAADPQIIVQAAIFEAIHPAANKIPIPGWVFEAFGLPAEDRCFRYEAMLFPDGRHVGQWGRNGSVPDIRQLETQLWFYYRARRYIDAGCEAFHFGQVHLYASLDRGYLHTADVLRRIRNYAHQHARRHFVLCDAHTHGIVIDGRLLFDAHAVILFLREVPGRPQKTLILRHGRSRGGITPSGWHCQHLPYLMEFDNYGGQIKNAPPSIDVRKADGSRYKAGEEPVPGVLWPWGYDEISWFAHQPADYRDEFLRYAWQWIKANDPNAHLQMPARRIIGAPVQMKDANGNPATATVYKANRPGEGCPTGFGQEESIRQIWHENPQTPADRFAELTQQDVNTTIETKPQNAAAVGSMRPQDYTAQWDPLRNRAIAGDSEFTRDPETGFEYPDTVVLAGTIQSALGGIAWDTDSHVCRMHHLGGGLYRLACVFPVAGEYAFRITVGGSWTENYGPNGIADGGNFSLNVKEDGQLVVFEFDYNSKELRMA